MGQVLQALGYSSSACNNATEALSEFKDGTYDVILTDYRMPEMTGIELCRQVRKCNSSVPVILMSGFNPTMEENEMRLSPINLILEKPIEMACLDRAIKSSILSSRSNEY